jgi:hypothetical protein
MKEKKTKLRKEKIAEIKKMVEDAPLESAKTELDRYIKTIVRYNFIESCKVGASFNELYDKEVRTWMEINSKLKDKKSFIKEMFGEKLSEEEKKKKNIEYYKRLTGWAKGLLSNLTGERKREIIMDCIIQEELWSNMFSEVCKLNREIEEKNKEVKKEVKKI